jgi:hypothetical protein
MILPGGLASEASFEDTNYCVQTEFAQRPKPRITTTISINGEVVNKVENVCDRLPQTDEDRNEVEKLLKRQHQDALENIKGNGGKLCSAGPQSQRIETSPEGLRPEVQEELSKTDGVLGWVAVPEGEGLADDKVSLRQEGGSQGIVLALERFSHLLSSVTKLGDLVGGILEVPKSRTVFLPLGNQFLAIRLDPEVDFKKLIKRIKSIA